MNKNLQSLSEILKNKTQQKKGTAYQWQQLALQIIQDLGVPSFKRSSIFKICKNYPEHLVLRALNDTKELCTTGDCWKYFFKVIDNDK